MPIHKGIIYSIAVGNDVVQMPLILGEWVWKGSVCVVKSKILSASYMDAQKQRLRKKHLFYALA
jgi:hypothetical protein